jgi:hypothetical protein
MRTITVVLQALLGTALTGVSANAGAWCANYQRGVSNCGYSSAGQCWATVRGLGDGFCAPNPYPGTAYGRAEVGVLASRRSAISAAISQAADP